MKSNREVILVAATPETTNATKRTDSIKIAIAER
jgi:hypothetical protein